MGFVLGRKLEHETPLVFRCEVAAGGDEGYLVCAVVAAAIVSSLNQFLLFVLQCVLFMCAYSYCFR